MPKLRQDHRHHRDSASQTRRLTERLNLLRHFSFRLLQVRTARVAAKLQVIPPACLINRVILWRQGAFSIVLGYHQTSKRPLQLFHRPSRLEGAHRHHWHCRLRKSQHQDKPVALLRGLDHRLLARRRAVRYLLTFFLIASAAAKSSTCRHLHQTTKAIKPTLFYVFSVAVKVLVDCPKSHWQMGLHLDPSMFSSVKIIPSRVW